MKNFYSVLFTLIICVAIWQPLSAQLSPGDIMFVAFRFDGNSNEDGNCGDGFAFAALVDIPADTRIYFTESEYNGSGWDEGEGDISWIHNEVLPAGSVVQITTNNQTTGLICGMMQDPFMTTSIGTVQFEGVDNWALSTSNEEIYAYLGAVRAPTVWLCALFTDNSDNKNVPPAELTGFILDFTNAEQDVDLGVLTAGTNCPDKATCLANILDLDNWTLEDGQGPHCCDEDGVDYPDDIPATLAPCVLPELTEINVIYSPTSYIAEAVGNLNGAAEWAWYTDGVCGQGNRAILNPITVIPIPGAGHTGAQVRGEGGCVTTPGDCTVYDWAAFTPTFAATGVSALCLGESSMNLSGGAPEGGRYSGPGVTDNGDGTFNFNADAAGEGMHTISYQVGAKMVTQMIEVFANPDVSLSLPADITIVPGMLPMVVQGTGLPTGGVYSDNVGAIVDDGNGMTFSVVDTLFGSVTITYTYTDPVTNCTNSTTQEVTIVDEPITDVEELEKVISIAIFPNPTSGKLLVSGLQPSQILVRDLKGRLIKQQLMRSNEIDLSGLSKGVYLLQVKVEDQWVYKRVLKE